MAKRDTDSGLPRRQPGQAADEVAEAQAHEHAVPDGETPGLYHGAPHIHRLGLIPHDHDENGRPVFHKVDAKFKPAGPVVSPLADTNSAAATYYDAVRDTPASDDTDPTLVVGNTEVIPAPAGNFSNPTAAARNDLAYPRPDASEGVLAVAMGISPADGDPIIAMRHAEESARVLIIGQHVGNMFQAIAPPDKQFVANADLRAVYHKIRQIADFHGIDLDEVS